MYSVKNEFNQTSEVQNIGNEAFQNAPFANILFANGMFANEVFWNSPFPMFWTSEVWLNSILTLYIDVILS